MTLAAVLMRNVLTRPRLLALAALGGLPVVLAAAARAGGTVATGPLVEQVVEGYCLGVLTPVVTLVLASATLGDLVEDRTLVYVWLTPVPRAGITAAAFATTLAVAAPLVVMPTWAAAAIAGAPGALTGAVVAAAAVAAAGYGAVFLALGLRVRRALVWGLAYLLVWEGAVARVASGAARLSIQVQARSVLAAVAERPPPRHGAPLGTAVLVVGVVAAVALVLTTRWLRDAEVA